MNLGNFMALTPFSGTFDLISTLLPEGIDPRELMIATLSQQNQNLLEVMDKAQSIFQVNQAKQKEAIDDLSKTNDELREALLKAEARNKESQLTLQAEIQTVNEKYQLQAETQKQEVNELNKLCETMKLHLKTYEEGLKRIESNLHTKFDCTEAQIESQKKDNDHIHKICESMKQNLKIYEQGLLVMEANCSAYPSAIPYTSLCMAHKSIKEQISKIRKDLAVLL